MPAGLRQHAFSGIDEEDGEVGSRRARHHVARVLLVTRRVGYDEVSFVGREEPVRDVNRDALFALGRQTVDQQREIEFAAPRPDLSRIDRERRKLILEHHLRVVQQPPDERRFSVVDAAAGDEAQQAALLLRAQV